MSGHLGLPRLSHDGLGCPSRTREEHPRLSDLVTHTDRTTLQLTSNLHHNRSARWCSAHRTKTFRSHAHRVCMATTKRSQRRSAPSAWALARLGRFAPQQRKPLNVSIKARTSEHQNWCGSLLTLVRALTWRSLHGRQLLPTWFGCWHVL